MSVLGTKGTFIIYKGKILYGVGKIIYKPINLDCEGQGIRGAPFIITPSEKIPKSFYIKGSRSHVHFKNITVNSIYFDNSSYIILENCRIKRCILKKCSEFKIINSKFKISYLEQSQDIYVGNCNIKTIKTKNSFNQNNTFNYCTIDRMKERTFKGMIFEKSKIKEIYPNNSLKNFIIDYYVPIFTIIFVILFWLFFSIFFILILN